MGSFSIIALFERFALLGAEWVMWVLAYVMNCEFKRKKSLSWHRKPLKL